MTTEITKVDNDTKAIIDGQRVIFGTIEGYSAKYGDDQQKAIDRAIRNGHETRWVNLTASVICADPGFYERDRAEWAGVPQLHVGNIVELAGELFKIERTHNRNFKLVAVQGGK